MNECFKCGISGEKARLFDVVSKEGIVKICSRCFPEESLPLIKRPTTSQIKDAEKQQTYRESIKQFNRPQVIRNDLRKQENVSLRDIVDRNLKINLKEEIKPRPDLIENFHWVIMRERRAKHISREQFAKDLGESETLIKMVEQGVLPENDNLIINKIEGYLNINLRKPEFSEQVKKKELGFDSGSVANLTISDLREMKDKREGEIFLNSTEVWEGDIEPESNEKIKESRATEERDKSETEDKELSQKDIDDLIFGK